MKDHKHERRFTSKMQADSFYSVAKYDLNMDCSLPYHFRNRWIVEYSGCPSCKCDMKEK